MTGAIKSTPVKDLESTTGIQPLCDRRDMKMLVQDVMVGQTNKHTEGRPPGHRK